MYKRTGFFPSVKHKYLSNMSKSKTSQCENKESQEKTEKNKKAKKVVNIIADVLFYVVCALLVVVLVCFFVDKFSGEETYPFFGFRGMIVQTDSMAIKNPEFVDFLEGHDEQMEPGDLVFTRRLKKGEELKVYDIVTFKLGQMTVIHRIVDIYVEDGVTYYVTRGDSRELEKTDSPKTIDQITGVYASNWGTMGKFVKFVQSIYGILAIILCLTIVVIAMIVMKFINKENEKNKNNKKQTEKKENKNKA